MRCNFERALAHVLAHEGGYVDHPLDPGGATKFGVTRRTLAEWRGVSPWRALPKEEVHALTRDEAGAIYRAEYWDAVRGDELPGGVDYAVFDYAVNSGTRHAAKELQRVAGTRADGVIGERTLKAVWRRDPARLVRRLCRRRLSFLRGLDTWSAFGRGWTSRVSGVRERALAMTEKESEAMSFIDGYKTYIVVSVFILGVVVEVFLGLDVPGFEPGENWLEYIMGALGLGALRNGVTRAGQER